MMLEISEIKVMINTGATDIVFMTPMATTPYPQMNYPPLIKLEAACGYGVEWVQKTFGREPDEIIDLKK